MPVVYFSELVLKFGFSEKATNFERIFVVLLTRASCSVRAQQRTCQKVDEDFLKQMWTSRIIQTLNWLMGCLGRAICTTQAHTLAKNLAFSDPGSLLHKKF